MYSCVWGEQFVLDVRFKTSSEKPWELVTVKSFLTGYRSAIKRTTILIQRKHCKFIFNYMCLCSSGSIVARFPFNFAKIPVLLLNSPPHPSIGDLCTLFLVGVSLSFLGCQHWLHKSFNAFSCYYLWRFDVDKSIHEINYDFCTMLQIGNLNDT